MPRQVIEKGSTVWLVTYPKVRASEGETLPNLAAANFTSSTVKVTTPKVTAPVAGAATVDTASALTAVAAGAGETVLSLDTSITLTRGERMRLGLPTGEVFVVRCSLTASGQTLQLASPLPVDVPIGTKVSHLAIKRQLSTNETSIEGMGLVAWTLIVDNNDSRGPQNYAWDETFEIVRRVPRWELDADELERRFPEVLALRESNDLALDETIDGALEQELLPRLRAKQILESNIITTWPLVAPHVCACRLFLAMNDRSTTEAYRKELRGDLEQSLALALQDVDRWYDAPQDADPVPDDNQHTDLSGLGYTR